MKNLRFEMKKFILLLLATQCVFAMLASIPTASYNPMYQPEKSVDSYYLINPQMPCALNLRLENDSVMRLWVDNPEKAGLSDEEAEEWILYRKEERVPVMIKNITNRYNQGVKTNSKRSNLLHLWAGVKNIAKYNFNRPLFENCFINGYPLINIKDGNPYNERYAPEGFSLFAKEYCLSMFFPDQYLNFFTFITDAYNSDKTKRLLYQINVSIDKHILRVEYEFSDNETVAVDEYYIDLKSSLVTKNPGIRIGKLINTTRSRKGLGLDKKTYSDFMKLFPTLEGKTFQILTPGDVSFEYAYIGDNLFYRSKSELEKRANADANSIMDINKWSFTIDGKPLILLRDVKRPPVTSLPFKTKGK